MHFINITQKLQDLGALVAKVDQVLLLRGLSQEFESATSLIK